MARGLLTASDILVTGTTPPAETNGDPTNKHYFVNDARDRCFLSVRNANVASQDIVFEIPGEVDTGINKTDRTIAIPAGATRLIGPFSSTVYNQTTDPDTLGTTEAVYVNPAHADLKLILYAVPAPS